MSDLGKLDCVWSTCGKGAMRSGVSGDTSARAVAAMRSSLLLMKHLRARVGRTVCLTGILKDSEAFPSGLIGTGLGLPSQGGSVLNCAFSILKWRPTLRVIFGDVFMHARALFCVHI
jgi:hypothetical protein